MTLSTQAKKKGDIWKLDDEMSQPTSSVCFFLLKRIKIQANKELIQTFS